MQYLTFILILFWFWIRVGLATYKKLSNSWRTTFFLMNPLFLLIPFDTWIYKDYFFILYFTVIAIILIFVSTRVDSDKFHEYIRENFNFNDIVIHLAFLFSLYNFIWWILWFKNLAISVYYSTVHIPESSFVMLIAFAWGSSFFIALLYFVVFKNAYLYARKGNFSYILYEIKNWLAWFIWVILFILQFKDWSIIWKVVLWIMIASILGNILRYLLLTNFNYSKDNFILIAIVSILFVILNIFLFWNNFEYACWFLILSTLFNDYFYKKNVSLHKID